MAKILARWRALLLPRVGAKEHEAGERSSGRRSPLTLGWIVSGACLLIYLASGQSQQGNDATATVHQALRLIEQGTLFFTPEDNPRMFVFAVDTPFGTRLARIRDWQLSDGRVSARQAYAAGKIRVQRPMYYLVPTRHAGHYANTFGVGAGLAALPLVAPVRLFVPDLGSRPELLWWVGKIAAALTTAATVLLLYLASLRWVSPRSAALLSLAYGLGTCAFSVSSQAPWQHGPCEMFTALGAYFLLANEGKRSHALSGLGFALAVLCRPTAVLVAACVAIHLALTDRRRLLWFALGALPAAVALVAYSEYAFGSFISFGQLLAGVEVAKTKTGQSDLWQTPLWLGTAGLLLSPSRGLFVYTPLAIFSLWGIGRAFRDAAWKDLRPLAFGALLLLVVAAKRFDWWGGWCFGYRPIVDAMILLALLSLPVIERVAASRKLQAACLLLFGYSFAVQVIGAFVYDVSGWNGRIVWEVVDPSTAERLSFDDRQTAARTAQRLGGSIRRSELNVDAPEHRHRLWSWTDSPLVYYVTRVSAARERRKRTTEKFIREQG